MERFQHWFPFAARDLVSLSQDTCNATLQAFQQAYEASPNHAAINLGTSRGTSKVIELCKQHASCLLANSSEWAKANFGTSNIILGLLPTVLAVIAPSMTELALLSKHRPTLAALLSLGSPAILQARVFNYDDPGELLKIEYNRQDLRSPLMLGPWSRGTSMVIGILGYFLAAAAIVNTMTLVVLTSRSSIISWGCTRTWPLFVWAFVPIIIHLLVSMGYRLTLDKNVVPETTTQIQSAHGTVQEVGDKPNNHDTVNYKSETTFQVSKLKPVVPMTPKTLRQRLLGEITSCVSHTQQQSGRLSRMTRQTRVQTGILLNTLAGFLGFLHLIFGTVSFSALMFISPLDAISQITMRLMLSAVISRCVVMFELSGLRGAVVDRQGSGTN